MRKLTPAEYLELGLEPPKQEPPKPTRKLRKVTPEELEALGVKRTQDTRPARKLDLGKPAPVAPAAPKVDLSKAIGGAAARMQAQQASDKQYEDMPFEAASTTALDTAALGLLPQTLAIGDEWADVGLDLTPGDSPLNPATHGKSYEQRRDYYRRELEKLQDANRLASLGGGLAGAVPGSAISAGGKLASTAGRVGQAALQGANTARPGETLKGAAIGGGAGLVGEAAGAVMGGAPRVAARTVRALGDEDGFFKALVKGVTGGADKEALEAKMLQSLRRQETKSLTGERRAYDKRLRDVENAVRKEVYDAPNRIARLSPEEKAAEGVAKAQAALEALKRQEGGMVGQYSLQDQGYVRDALFLSGGDKAAARSKLEALVPEADRARVLSNFDALVSGGEENLAARLGRTPQERAALEFAPKLEAAQQAVRDAEARRAATKAASAVDPAVREAEVMKKLAEASKNVPKPSGTRRDINELRKQAILDAQDYGKAIELDPQLARRVLVPPLPAWAEKTLDVTGRVPPTVARGGAALMSEDEAPETPTQSSSEGLFDTLLQYFRNGKK